LFLYFFGEDSKKRMQLKSFDDFLKGLHDEIVRLEFAHYDFKNQVSKLLELTKLSVPVMPLTVPAILLSVKLMLLPVPVMLSSVPGMILYVQMIAPLVKSSVKGLMFSVPMIIFCPCDLNAPQEKASHSV